MQYDALAAQGLSPGKLFGIRQIANPNGTFTMLALDQNNSIVQMARDALQRQGDVREPAYAEVVAAKLDLTRLLAPHASACLLDVQYGAWHAVASGRFPRGVGLLVRLERSGTFHTDDGTGRLTFIEDGWSVEKIKRMGADAVKLLVYYEPSHKPSAREQRKLVRKVERDCQKHDILLLLETLTYPFKGEEKTSETYLKRKPQAVIRTARALSRHCDVYKAEFPGTLEFDSDKKLARNLERLNAACARPWVLLSAGVDFPLYKKQVQMALDAGASGILGGRAFWKEYFDADGDEARRQWLQTESSERLIEVGQMVRDHATPWYARYGWSAGELDGLVVPEGWYMDYGKKPRRKASSPPGDAGTGEY